MRLKNSLGILSLILGYNLQNRNFHYLAFCPKMCFYFLLTHIFQIQTVLHLIQEVNCIEVPFKRRFFENWPHLSKVPFIWNPNKAGFFLVKFNKEIQPKKQIKLAKVPLIHSPGIFCIRNFDFELNACEIKSGIIKKSIKLSLLAMLCNN